MCGVGSVCVSGESKRLERVAAEEGLKGVVGSCLTYNGRLWLHVTYFIHIILDNHYSSSVPWTETYA